MQMPTNANVESQLSTKRATLDQRAARLTSDHIRVPQIQLLVEDHELASADGGSR